MICILTLFKKKTVLDLPEFELGSDSIGNGIQTGSLVGTQEVKDERRSLRYYFKILSVDSDVKKYLITQVFAGRQFQGMEGKIKYFF